MNERELLAAHDDLMSDITRWAVAHRHNVPDSHPGKYAPASVPGWVIPRLERYALSLGYPVTRTHDIEWKAIGFTQTLYNPREYRPVGISILPDMTPASTARVLSHEIAHAMESRKLADDVARFRLCLRGGMTKTEERAEELAAETCAALVTRALRISDGDDFSLWYLATSSTGPDDCLSARDEGARRASALLKGIA